MSLLPHHQDFTTDPEHLEDFVEYIMFYLKNVATESNLPMIYHLSQRLKMVEDGIDPEKSENLYILSDIAEAVIRYYKDLQGWPLQVISSKAGLPSGLFSKLPSHSVAQEIAEKRYIPEELADELEDLVKNSMKTKKRKSDGTTSSQASKKPKPSTTEAKEKKQLPVRKAPKPVKTPKKKADDAIPSSERRKSTRAANKTNYAEHDDSEDDEELEQWQADEDEEANKENMESSTPPTSDTGSSTCEKGFFGRKERGSGGSCASHCSQKGQEDHHAAEVFKEGACEKHKDNEREEGEGYYGCTER